MFSSALGDRLLKFSQASNRIAEGEVDPGRKTDTLDAETAISKASDIVGRFYYLELSVLSHTHLQR
jgi:hypothetical protein